MHGHELHLPLHLDAHLHCVYPGWPMKGPRVAEGARRGRRRARWFRGARRDRRHRGPPRRRAAPRSSYQRVCTRPRLGKALAARPRGAGWLARWEVGARGLRRGPHRPRGGRPSGCRDCRRGRPPLFGLGTVGEVWVLLPLAARCPSRGAAGTPRFGRRGQAPPSLLRWSSMGAVQGPGSGCM